ncbi:AP endonuclease, partial [Rhizobium leguminosarum]
VSRFSGETLLRQTDEICAVITKLPQPDKVAGQRFRTPYLTVMDWGHDERDFAAGHSDRAPRLDEKAWAGMIANITAIAELAQRKYGVRA